MVKKQKTDKKDSQKKFRIEKFFDEEVEEISEAEELEELRREKGEVSEEVLQREYEEAVAVRERNIQARQELYEKIEQITERAPTLAEQLRDIEQDYGSEKESQPIRRIDPGHYRPLPGKLDPKLWLVRCKAGKELLAMQYIMRYLASLPDTDECPINNAFCLNPKRGYFYIEAYKSREVEAVLRTAPFVTKRNAFSPVPLDEVQSSFKITRPNLPAAPLDFVRVEHGPYRNDIAQVVSVYQERQAYRIRVLPRVRLEGGRKERPEPRRLTVDLLEAKALKYKFKLFREDGLDYIFFRNKLYRGGLLYFTMKATSVSLLTRKPTQDEAKYFFVEDGDVLDNKEAKTVDDREEESAELQKMELLYVGDKVQVDSGELQSLRGEIISIERGSARIRLLDSKHLNKDFEVAVSLALLRKRFDEGDQARVTSGKNRGLEGLIIKCNDDLVQIYTGDAVIEERTCNLSSGGTKDSDREKNKRKALPVGSLVDLGGDTVGVVLGMSGAEGQFVLNNKNERVVVPIENISKFDLTDSQSSFDCTGMKINKNNIVMCNSGQYEGLKGTVLCNYQQYIFVQAFNMNVQGSAGGFASGTGSDNMSSGRARRKKRIINPSKLFALKSTSCAIDKGSLPSSSENIIAPSIGLQRIENPENFLGKQVTITRGKWKSKVGNVKAINANFFLVELFSTGETIRIPCNQVVHVKEK